jgi:hypothetical protein
MKTSTLYIILLLIKVGDSISTYLVLSRGGYELNPIMASLMKVSPILFYAAVPFIFATVITSLILFFGPWLKEVGVPNSIPLLVITILTCTIIASNLIAYHSTL